VRVGLDVLFDRHLHLLKGKRVGLVVNPTSLNSAFRHAADIFFHCPEFQLTALFGPQHGIRGETQDNMIEWEGWHDRKTGLPVYSLYGHTRIPTPSMLEAVDVLVFDMQDVGTRVYTFIYTMANCMIAAANHNINMVVLDRPNPIGGTSVEGNVLDPRFASFVGMFPIPMRHGMTIGELALMFNEAFDIRCRLEVVPMEGWSRRQWYDETDLLWVIPSPNLPTLDTATVYPGMVLIEGTMVSEGRGTTRPFEIIGAPYIDPDRLVRELERETLPGVFFRPCYFQPTFHKHAGQLCGGLQIHVVDRDVYKPVITGVAVIKAIHRLYPDHFQWKQPPYEYVSDKLPFDVIAGTDQLRQQIIDDVPLSDIEASWEQKLSEFLDLRKQYLLYE
jgi:uncharacterized protein YbbC (DUF1343 family)